MSTFTQRARLKQALEELGPDASSVQLYNWIAARWPKQPGFKGPVSVAKVRPQVQEGWRSPRHKGSNVATKAPRKPHRGS